ncbi:MAG: VWA domain-containing protein [Chitinophagaceae bacterium]
MIPDFAYPYLLILLALLPVLYWYAKKRERSQTAAILFSDTRKLPMEKTWKLRLRNFPLLLRLLALACCIVALARPQQKNDIEVTEGQGIDIVLCIDVSGSMLAQDFKPDRMGAAKNVALDFIERRKGDRIGLVIFSGESFAMCPLTTDKAVLRNQINSIQNGILTDGTAIGSGLASSVDRLKSSTSKSKVVILLTDGENTGGLIDPQTAKELAKTYGIKVYTIGVGTQGMAPTPYQTPLGVQMVNEKVSIDEVLLKQIAAETKGKYYRATDNAELQNIYSSIDMLEKSKVESTTFRKRTEQFHPWVLAALLLLFVEAGLRLSLLRKFP